MATKPNWKIELEKMHLDDIAAKSPGFFKASGGYDMKLKPYTDTNTNGLTRCVIAWDTFKGHYTVRSGNQGQARIQKIPIGGTQLSLDGKGAKTYSKVHYTKNPDGKGKADLQSNMWGLFVSKEIKCEATKDRMRDGQSEHRDRVELSGGIYIIIPSMEWYYNWYIEFEKKFKK